MKRWWAEIAAGLSDDRMIVGVLFDLNVYRAIQGITSLVSLHLFFGLGFCSIHPVYLYLHCCSGPT